MKIDVIQYSTGKKHQINIKRKINVINQDWVEEPVCVVADGICNHADTHFETDEEDSYNAVQEYVGSLPVEFEICNKCKMYRRVYDDDYPSDWQGLGVYPL